MIVMDGRDGEMQGDVQYQMVSMMIHERLAQSAAAQRAVASGRAEHGWSMAAAMRRLVYGAQVAQVARVDATCPTPRHAGATR